MKSLLMLFLGLVSGFLGAGLILLAARQPHGEAVILNQPPTPRPVMVHVSGAVLHPGVYALPYNSRVVDGLEAAGGAAPGADTGKLNQAAFLEDGGLLLVPTLLPTQPPAPPRSAAATRTAAPPAAQTAGKININTATAAELESLPWIGPATAQKIIAYRQAHGPFKTIQAIIEVPGIGQKTFEAIQDLITV
ncbi:MAG: ComEA family DNA-binding protein [Chloroflexota bacterium]